MRDTPLANSFFRPEENHVSSRENNVVPPFGRGNKTMKKPIARWWTIQANFEVERFIRLFAAGMNPTTTMQRRRYAE
jgi:hypothetical protein